MVESEELYTRKAGEEIVGQVHIFSSGTGVFYVFVLNFNYVGLDVVICDILEDL